jgi:hypothetical protein
VGTNRRVRQFSVDVVDGNVVMTLSARQLHELAAAWDGTGPEKGDWLKDLNVLLMVLLVGAGGQPTVASKPNPRMKAAHFMRGGWDFTVAEDSTTNERFLASYRSPAEGRGTLAPDHSPIGSSVAVAVEALAIASEAQADWASELEAGAAHAAAAVRDEVYAAANRAAAAAQVARVARATAVAMAVDDVANTVAQAAAAIQSQADADAIEVAHSASNAASVTKAAILPGGEAAAALSAQELAETVASVAVATAKATAVAAAEVARAATAAALIASATAADAAMALELEVASAAAAVESAAVAAADQVIDHTNALATHRAKERR